MRSPAAVNSPCASVRAAAASFDCPRRSIAHPCLERAWATTSCVPWARPLTTARAAAASDRLKSPMTAAALASARSIRASSLAGAGRLRKTLQRGQCVLARTSRRLARGETQSILKVVGKESGERAIDLNRLRPFARKLVIPSLHKQPFLARKILAIDRVLAWPQLPPCCHSQERTTPRPARRAWAHV